MALKFPMLNGTFFISSILLSCRERIYKLHLLQVSITVLFIFYPFSGIEWKDEWMKKVETKFPWIFLQSFWLLKFLKDWVLPSIITMPKLCWEMEYKNLCLQGYFQHIMSSTIIAQASVFVPTVILCTLPKERLLIKTASRSRKRFCRHGSSEKQLKVLHTVLGMIRNIIYCKKYFLYWKCYRWSSFVS